MAKAVSMNDSAQVPETAKQFAWRNHLFHEGRVLLAKGDIAAAKGKLSELTKQVAIGQIPFELRQQHELAGAIALAEKRYQPAVDELKQASQQDPRVMYLTALALQGAGDHAGARTLAAKAARFNGSNINYGFVRAKAQKIAGS